MGLLDVVLNDGTPTTGDHTFTGNRVDMDFAEYISTWRSDLFLGREKLMVSYRRPTGGGVTDRAYYTLDIPILRGVAAGEADAAGYVPSPAVDSRALIKTEIILPRALTSEVRGQIFGLNQSIATKAIIQELILNGRTPS